MIQILKTWEILVPYKMGDHNGTDPDKPKRKRNVPVPYHQIWDEKVRTITGGLTICKVAKGQWVNPDGRLFRELMIPVRISCSEEQITEIIKMTADHYEQEAVHCMCISERTIIYHRTPSNHYDPAYGDDKLCECGHTYYRHFDSYEEMSPVGCKYCRCDKFVLVEPGTVCECGHTAANHIDNGCTTCEACRDFVIPVRFSPE